MDVKLRDMQICFVIAYLGGDYTGAELEYNDLVYALVENPPERKKNGRTTSVKVFLPSTRIKVCVFLV